MNFLTDEYHLYPLAGSSQNFYKKILDLANKFFFWLPFHYPPQVRSGQKKRNSYIIIFEALKKFCMVV